MFEYFAFSIVIAGVAACYVVIRCVFSKEEPPVDPDDGYYCSRGSQNRDTRVNRREIEIVYWDD